MEGKANQKASKESGKVQDAIKAALIEAEALREAGRQAEAEQKAIAEKQAEAKEKPSQLPEVNHSALLAEAEAKYKELTEKALSAKRLTESDRKELAEAQSKAAKKAKLANLVDSQAKQAEAEAALGIAFSALEVARKAASEAASIKAANNPEKHVRKESTTPKADVIRMPLDYSLFVQAEGIKRHDSDYKAFPLELTARQAYVNTEGFEVDRHVILNTGAIFDAITTIKIEYKKAEAQAYMTLVYMPKREAEGKIISEERFEIASGINDEKAEIKPQALTYGKTTKKHKASDYILCDAKSESNCRFWIAKILPYCLPYLASRFSDTSGDLITTLHDKMESINRKLAEVQNTIAELTLSGKPCAKQTEKRQSLLAELINTKKAIREAMEGKPKPELTEAEAEAQAEAEAKRKAQKAELIAKMQAEAEAALQKALSEA